MNLYIYLAQNLFHPDCEGEIRYAVFACDRYVLVVIVQYRFYYGEPQPYAVSVKTP